jgi:hypothetical protein
MRNLGGILLLVGIGGFIYCHSQLGTAGPLPEGLTITEALEYSAGRFEVGRYAAAFMAVFGFLLVMFPKSR